MSSPDHTHHLDAAARTERALAMPHPRDDRSAIMRARLAVVEEIRLNRAQLAHLAHHTPLIDLADDHLMEACVLRLRKLGARINTLEECARSALVAQVAEDMPGATVQDDGSIAYVPCQVDGCEESAVGRLNTCSAHATGRNDSYRLAWEARNG